VLIPGTGKPSRHFVGQPGPPPDTIRANVEYSTHLSGPAGGLGVGAPVTLRGFQVGHVLGVRLAYDAHTGALSTPVTIGIDTARLGVSVPRLIQAGLRARLVHEPPLVGAAGVELTMVKGGRVPVGLAQGEIPAAPREGIDRAMQEVGDLPIEQIGANVSAITSHVRSLVSAPQLEGSIDHLDRTLATLDTTMQTAGPAVTPMIRQLGQTATELDATVASVRRMAGGSPAPPDGNLQDALRELTGAARAMRTLANFLDTHPEALISGRQR
jgi:paraquat-inducible protein B